MKDKDRMLVLSTTDGVEYFRCKIEDISSISRKRKDLGAAGAIEYCTLHTRGGSIDLYEPNYDALLVKLGWNDI